MSLFFLLLAGIAMAQEAPLRPGDRIRVTCDEEATLCVDRSIGPSGVVKLPLVGSMTLAGSTPGQAATSIKQALRRKMPEFAGNVRVELIPSTDVPISYLGAVKRAGELPFRTGLRLSEVLETAEPTEAAELEAIVITSATGEKIVVDSTDPGRDPELRSGDRVYVPLATSPREVLVLGGVAKPGSVPFVRGITLAQVIEGAGGVNGHGLADKIKLVRGGKEIATLDLSASGSQALLRGDVVMVSLADRRSYITVIGEVKTPGFIEFHDGMTLRQVIAAAGGLGPDAAPEIIEVRTMIGPKRGVKKYDFGKIESGAAKDVVLKSSEVVAVPPTSYREMKQESTGRKPVVPPAEAAS